MNNDFRAPGHFLQEQIGEKEKTSPHETNNKERERIRSKRKTPRLLERNKGGKASKKRRIVLPWSCGYAVTHEWMWT